MSTQPSSGEEEMEVPNKAPNPDSTDRNTIYGVKKFNEWLAKSGRQCDFATVSMEDLNAVLLKYYEGVGSSKPGKPLTPSTLTCLRAALHRHLTAAPFNRPFNIINDSAFQAANNMFIVRCKLYFKDGNAKPQHKPAISEEDMMKLGRYFENFMSSPDVLTESCWFYLCYFFGRRGREGWTALKKNFFVIKTDPDGTPYVTTSAAEVTKNRQGGNKPLDQGSFEDRMYGFGVDIYKQLKLKLNPGNDRLFQNSLRVYKQDGHWFKNEPMGKNTMSTMMQRISKKAGLTQVYTCHSIRLSNIARLYQTQECDLGIQGMTEHQNQNTLPNYADVMSSKQYTECEAFGSNQGSSMISDNTVSTHLLEKVVVPINLIIYIYLPLICRCLP